MDQQNFEINSGNARIRIVITLSLIIHISLVVLVKIESTQISKPSPTLIVTQFFPNKESSQIEPLPSIEKTRPLENKNTIPKLHSKSPTKPNRSPSVSDNKTNKNLINPKQSPSGTDLLIQSIESIRSGTMQNKPKMIWPYTTLSNSEVPRTLTNSYITPDGHTRIVFKTADGKVYCSEIREKDPLDEFDNSRWSIVMSGCEN